MSLIISTSTLNTFLWTNKVTDVICRYSRYILKYYTSSMHYMLLVLFQLLFQEMYVNQNGFMQFVSFTAVDKHIKWLLLNCGFY